MTAAEIASGALAFGAVLGGVGYAVGQFFSSRRKGLADTLATSLSEIDLLSRVVHRLEAEMHIQATELGALKAENATLRSAVGGGEPVIRRMEQAKAEIEAFAHAEHEKTRELILRVRKEEK